MPRGRMTGSALPLAHIVGDALVHHRKPSEHLQERAEEPRLTGLCASPLMMCAYFNGHIARGAAGPSMHPADLAAGHRELLAMPRCGLRRVFAPPLRFALSSRGARTGKPWNPRLSWLCMYLSADDIYFDAERMATRCIRVACGTLSMLACNRYIIVRKRDAGASTRTSSENKNEVKYS